MSARLFDTLALCGLLAMAAGGAAANPVSAFPVNVDGRFSGAMSQSMLNA